MQSTDNSDPTEAITVERLLRRARRSLSDRLEADLLACHALGRDRSWLYAHGGEAVDTATARRLDHLVGERLAGRPIAQICGYREFYGRAFRVDEWVLVPRPETELLVELALACPVPRDAVICDVGTGSGCVALTIAAERPGWRVMATDASERALAVAAENRDRLGLETVTLHHGDLLAGLAPLHFDLIVSNPPYIAEDDPHLGCGDLRFEPRQALAAGPDGLDLIRRLVPTAFDRLEAGGWLLIEHGYDQAAAVRGLLVEAGFSGVSSQRDLAGIERVTLGTRRPATAP
jgi:release factor glutamine methyltransferase